MLSYIWRWSTLFHCAAPLLSGCCQALILKVNSNISIAMQTHQQHVMPTLKCQGSLSWSVTMTSCSVINEQYSTRLFMNTDNRLHLCARQKKALMLCLFTAVDAVSQRSFLTPKRLFSSFFSLLFLTLHHALQRQVHVKDFAWNVCTIQFHNVCSNHMRCNLDMNLILSSFYNSQGELHTTPLLSCIGGPYEGKAL